jgi:hypothetical protein
MTPTDFKVGFSLFTLVIIILWMMMLYFDWPRGE